MYQLFDVDNHVNRHAVDYIFNTEGHLFPVSAMHLRQAAAGSRSRRTSVKHSRRKNIETAAMEETDRDDEMKVFTLPRLYNLTSNVCRSLSVMIIIWAEEVPSPPLLLPLPSSSSPS